MLLKKFWVRLHQDLEQGVSEMESLEQILVQVQDLFHEGTFLVEEHLLLAPYKVVSQEAMDHLRFV